MYDYFQTTKSTKEKRKGSVPNKPSRIIHCIRNKPPMKRSISEASTDNNYSSSIQDTSTEADLVESICLHVSDDSKKTI